jgi:hypothetical protein
MRIEVMRPNEGFLLTYVHVYGVSKHKIDASVGDILIKKRITLLGPWEETSAAPSGSRGIWGSFRAPAFLEDEHVKPRKTRTLKSK